MYDYVSRLQSLRKIMIKSLAKSNLNTSDRNIKTFKRLKNEVPSNTRKYASKKSQPPCDDKPMKSSSQTKIDAKKTECQKLIAQAFGLEMPLDECTKTARTSCNNYVHMKSSTGSSGQTPTAPGRSPCRGAKKLGLCHDPCGSSAPKLRTKPRDTCAPEGNPFDPCHGPIKKERKPKPCWYAPPCQVDNVFSAKTLPDSGASKPWSSVNAATAFLATQGGDPQKQQLPPERLNKSECHVVPKPLLNSPLERAPTNPFIMQGLVSPRPQPRKKKINLPNKTLNTTLTKTSSSVRVKRPHSAYMRKSSSEKTDISIVNDIKKVDTPFYENLTCHYTVAHKTAAVETQLQPQKNNDESNIAVINPHPKIPKQQVPTNPETTHPTSDDSNIYKTAAVDEKSSAKDDHIFAPLKPNLRIPQEQVDTKSQLSFRVVAADTNANYESTHVTQQTLEQMLTKSTKDLNEPVKDPKIAQEDAVADKQMLPQKSNNESQKPIIALTQPQDKPLEQQPAGITGTASHVAVMAPKVTEERIDHTAKEISGKHQFLSPLERKFAKITVTEASNLHQNREQDIDDKNNDTASLIQPLMPPEYFPSNDNTLQAQYYEEPDPNIPAINANKLEIPLSDQPSPQSLLPVAAVVATPAPPLPKKRDPCDRLKKGFIYDFPKRVYSTYTSPIRVNSAHAMLGCRTKHSETTYYQITRRSFHTLRPKSSSQPCLSSTASSTNKFRCLDSISAAAVIRNMSVDTSCNDTTRKTRPKKGDPPKKDRSSCWEPEKKKPWPDPCVWKPACSGKVNPCTENTRQPPPAVKFSNVFVRGFEPWTPIPAYHPPPAGICERRLPLYPCPRNPGEFPRKQGPCSDVPDPCWHPDLKRRPVCKDPPPCLPLPKKRFSGVDAVFSYMNGMVLRLYNVGDF